MTPETIQAIRHALGENTEAFGRRFHRSGRSVEKWEQGTRNPDPLALEVLKTLDKQAVSPSLQKS